MGVREETVALLIQGMTPGQIASSRGVTFATTLAYLDEMIGRGKIRRSDILFSIPTNKRNAIFEALSNGASTSSAISATLRRLAVDVSNEEIAVVQKYGDASHALGDIYENVCMIEVRLHKLVRACLESIYGEDDDEWWRQGVARNIRGKCGERREMEDADPAEHAYCYTDLLDLKEIINKKWQIISPQLPAQAVENKKQLMHHLERLNLIRRKVMHPVRGDIPTKDDFDFLRALKSQLGFT